MIGARGSGALIGVEKSAAGSSRRSRRLARRRCSSSFCRHWVVSVGGDSGLVRWFGSSRAACCGSLVSDSRRCASRPSADVDSPMFGSLGTRPLRGAWRLVFTIVVRGFGSRSTKIRLSNDQKCRGWASTRLLRQLQWFNGL